MTVLNSSAAHC